MKRIYLSLAIACLLAGTLSAADDPFCGKWKLNAEKSKLTGEQMKIQDLGGGKYKISSGNVSNTIIADGTDQPGHFGRTASIAPQGTNQWKMVIKKDGRIVSSMTHTLSGDGRTQVIKGTETKPDGTTSDFNVVMTRVGTGSGWGGTWEETDEKSTSPDELDIEPYDGNGLTFNTPAWQETLSMKFEGKDYEKKGPDVPPGSLYAGSRPNSHTLDLTGNVKGQVMDHLKYEVSPDGKTLTLTVSQTGQPKAQTYVYDKM